MDAPVLVSRAITAGEQFDRNAAAQRQLVEELRSRLAEAALGGSAASRERHAARGKLLPRDRVDGLLDPGSPLLELSPLAADGMYGGDVPGAGIITGVGLVAGRRCVVVANDATVKGGTYHPVTVKKHLRAQEVAAENRLPCIYLVDSGGAFPARAGRGLPRPRALRPHLLQPGPPVGARHPSGGGRARVVHRRWRVRARDVRRVGHRPRPGHHLPRRTAAREGRDRRGRHGRGAGRGRPALQCLGGHGPPGRRRPARAGDRAQHHRHHAAARRPSLGGVAPGGARGRPRPALRGGAGRRADALRRPRDHRPARGRQPLPRVQARLRRHPRHRVRPHLGSPRRHHRQQRRALLRVGHERCALHRAVRPARRAAALPAEHHRLHGRSRLRGRGHRQARGQDGDGSGVRACAEADRRHRWLVRGRQLQHVRAGVLAPLPLDVAERPHLGDGRTLRATVPGSSTALARTSGSWAES